ncbi:hypothetical protein D3C87_1367490 [compost metagenome]
MIVTLDGESFKFHPGAQVRHLIDRLPPEWQIRIRNGLAVVTDADGNELGEGGALSPGAQYHLKINL